MATKQRMGYRAALDWLIDNDDLADFIRRDHDSIPTIASSLAADIFGKTDAELRVALQRRVSERHAVKQRYGE